VNFMKNLFSFKQISIVLFIAFAVLFSANIAKACSCISSSLDSAIEDSANIVILKLQAVEKYQEGEKGYGYGGIKQSKLTVEKVFKGNLKVGQELIFTQGGGDCVWTFNEKIIGMDFLFFLGKKPNDNLWAAFVCSRSNSVKSAADDLMYLEKMSKVKGKTRLSGTIMQVDEPAVAGEEGSYKRLAGIKVTIVGNGKKIELKTDENGVYEIYDLPVGKYKVTTEKINGYKSNNSDGYKSTDWEEVEIEAESLSEQDFRFTIDNSISGKIFDSKGNVLESVCLDLIPTRGEKPPYFYKFNCTDKNGYFKIDEIPIGSYVIVINEKNEISARQPFGTFFYPNKTNREEAVVITIGPGNHFKDLIINAPNTAETITISGVLLFADGKPVINEAVVFHKNVEDISQIDKYRPDSSERTDENGRFTIRILKGQKGILFGSMYVTSSESKKCPQLEKLINEKGGESSGIETPAIQIEAVSNRIEVELKFPFPSCKKAKID